MTFARIWYEPTGVKITYFVDGADPAQVTRVLHADGHVSKDATFEDVKDKAELDALLPADRSERDKWVKAEGKRGVEVKRV